MVTKTFTFEGEDGYDVDYQFRYDITDELRMKYIQAIAVRPTLNANGEPIGNKCVPCTPAECIAILNFFDIIDLVSEFDDRLMNDDDFLNEEFEDIARKEFNSL